MTIFPIQPTEDSDHGKRFVANRIVRRLLDEGGIDLNDIHTWDVAKEERQQFAQLIGYSLSVYSELTDYVTDEAYEAASNAAHFGADETAARNEVLREQLALLRSGMRDAVAALYGLNSSDLCGDET